MIKRSNSTEILVSICRWLLFLAGHERARTDSTIPPPKKSVVCVHERFVTVRHDEVCYKENISKIFLVCKGLSHHDVRVARCTLFQDVRPGAGLKTGDLVKHKLEATVKRLEGWRCISVHNSSDHVCVMTNFPVHSSTSYCSIVHSYQISLEHFGY